MDNISSFLFILLLHALIIGSLNSISFLLQLRNPKYAF